VSNESFSGFTVAGFLVARRAPFPGAGATFIIAERTLIHRASASGRHTSPTVVVFCEARFPERLPFKERLGQACCHGRPAFIPEFSVFFWVFEDSRLIH